MLQFSLRDTLPCIAYRNFDIFAGLGLLMRGLYFVQFDSGRCHGEPAALDERNPQVDGQVQYRRFKLISIRTHAEKRLRQREMDLYCFSQRSVHQMGHVLQKSIHVYGRGREWLCS